MKSLSPLLLAGSLVFCGCATNRAHVGRAEYYPLLRLAAGAGDELSVRLLLESGADPTGFRDYEACYQKHGYGVERSSHLFVAAFAGELGVIRLLADAGADLNAMEGEGQTPLWAACMRGHIEVVRFLLSRGARRDLKGEGLTPLQVAQKYRFEAIVDLLREVPNKAPEPTRTSVTPRADARVAPAVRVAHL